jgi:hypothetical protein
LSKVSHLADRGCGAVKLDKIDHSSSEKKSFSSYLLFSRGETAVKGSGVVRSKTPLPLTARRSGGYLRVSAL